jgi:hypothetical protein
MDAISFMGDKMLGFVSISFFVVSSSMSFISSLMLKFYACVLINLIHDHGFIHVVVCFTEKFSLHVCVEISSMDNTVCVDHNFGHCLIKKPLVVTLKSASFTLLSWYIWMSNWMTYNISSICYTSFPSYHCHSCE